VPVYETRTITTTTPAGLKIDLKNGIFDSKGPLSISGDSVNINATGGSLLLSGPTFGLVGGDVENTGTTATNSDGSVSTVWQSGDTQLIYLSNKAVGYSQPMRDKTGDQKP